MSARVGNVLHELRQYIHPHVKHVVTQTIEHSSLQDQSNDPQEIHIRRQAVRIQSGNQPDYVTALLPSE
jgi:hypothetical protein